MTVAASPASTVEASSLGSATPSGPGKAAVGNGGSPTAVFKRAIERGNLLIAETTAREIGRLDLFDALSLTALIAQKDPRRRSRVSARWLQRYLEEHPAVTIDEAALAASSLAALGGPAHDEAAMTLGVLAERASSVRRVRHVAS